MIDPNKDNGVRWLISSFKSILQWFTDFYSKNKNIFRKIYDPKDWIGKYKKEKKSINVFKLIFYNFFLIVILIMAIDSIDLFYFRGKILHILWNLRVFRHFFVDKDGKFIWLGATSIITVITLGVNAWDNRRKFRADLISKSRIKWIADTKQIISEYYQVFSEYIYVYHKFFMEKRPEESEKLNNKLTGLMGKIRQKYYEISLSIPDNESNEPLLRNVKLTFGELNNIGKYYEYGRNQLFEARNPYYTVVDNYISNLINTGVRDSSIYFKKEWERAKKGE